MTGVHYVYVYVCTTVIALTQIDLFKSLFNYQERRS